MIPLQTTLLRLVLALVLGAFIGLERERGERAAGLRTHALVALGACLVMIVSAFGFADVQGGRSISLDPSRVAAQVVSGIGFLGAGTILLRKEIVKGLTTAATIWVVAAIGLACGGGLLIEGITAAVLTITVLTLLRPLREHLHRVPEVQHMRIKVVAKPSTLNQVHEICLHIGATLEQVELQTGNAANKMEITCATSEAPRLIRSLVALRTEQGVETISINLSNPTSDMALLPLFPEEQAEKH